MFNFKGWFKKQEDPLQQRLSPWQRWQSTKEAPSPSVHSGNPIDDLLAVLAGRKTAAFVDEDALREDPHAQQLLAMAQQKGMKITPYNGDYVIGQPQAVDQLVALLQKRETGWDDPNWHRSVGQNLGYSQEAIDDYLAGHDERVKQNKAYLASLPPGTQVREV